MPNRTDSLDEHRSRMRPGMRVLQLAALYVLTALPLRLLGSEFGFTLAIWPAAGVALGGLLAWGWRVWPGVWLGSFAVYLLSERSMEGALLAAVIASGATLQALLAAHLGRPLIRHRELASQDMNLFRILLLIGPLACSVGATTGTLAHLFTNRIEAAAAVNLWLMWWTGASVGSVLVTSGLLLAWNREDREGRHALARSFAPLIVTAILLVVGQLTLERAERGRELFIAQGRMLDEFDHALERIRLKAEALQGVERFLHASSEVSRAQFDSFTQPLSSMPAMVAVDWSPRLAHAQRHDFESRVRAKDLPSFRITEIDADGELTAAAARAEYFPVLYSASASAERRALGFGLDHGFEETRRTAIAMARDRGDSTVARVAPLVRTPGSTALLVLVPVYSGQPATLAERRAQLRGMVVGVIDLAVVFEPIERASRLHAMAFRIMDTTETNAYAMTGELSADKTSGYASRATVLGRQWQLELGEPPGLLLAATPLAIKLYWTLSLIVAVLAGAASISSTWRLRAVVSLVASRTAELERELQARAQAELRLRASEQHLGITLHSIGDAVLTTDASGNVTQMNPSAAQLTGWLELEAIGQPIEHVFSIIDEQTRLPVTPSIDLIVNEGRERRLGNHTTLLTRAGQERSVAYSAAPMYDGEGALYGAVIAFRDVGREKAAQQALQASEERYRRVIEQAPYGMFVQSGGRFVFINPFAIRLLGGTSASDFIGREVIDFIHGDYRQAVASRIADLNERRIAAQRMEQKWLRLDDSLATVECSAVPYEHEGASGALVMLNDISARREAEQLIDRFFELSPDLLCIIAPDGAIRRVNAALTTTLGWSSEELLAHSVEGFAPADDRSALARLLSQVQQDMIPSRPIERQTRCKDGSLRLLSWRLVGTETGMLFATARDITETRHAEQQIGLLNNELRIRLDERDATLQTLGEKEAELRAILNNLLDCVLMIDGDGIVRSCNSAVLSTFGYLPTELVGRHASLLIPGYSPLASDAGDTLAATAAQREQEVEARHRDGRAIPVELSWSTIVMRDAPVRIALLRDASERKRFIADLQTARAEAEHASHIKSAFLATMSHEIRTPMNGVIGLVDVLAHSRLDEHQSSLLRTVRESARILLGLIDDILDFSKIEAGRLLIESKPVQLADVVEGVCESLLPVARKSGVRLRTFVAPDLPAQVLSDDIRLHQMLYNLIGNAIKFSAGRDGLKGQVYVRAERCDDTGTVCFSIADNGIGMTAEVIDILFNPFVQAEASTTRRFGGTGLGLAICKRLVDLMGGTISVQSTPGEGSTFRIRLPLSVIDEESAAPAPELSGLCCILSKQELIPPADLRAYLESAGARVELRDTPEQACELAREIGAAAVVIKDGTNRSIHAGGSAEDDVFATLLVVESGNQRSRLIAPGVVSINGNAMPRKALLRAVAVASGRASPEAQHADLAVDQPLSTALPTIAEARAAGRLILVAEDDPINQQVITHQLTLLGHVAEIARNGEEALQMWRQSNYGLLLSDLHMPIMDGYQLTAAIRGEEDAGTHMPIVALTANALRSEAQRTRDAGMDDYMTKPVQLPALRALIDRYLSGNSEASIDDEGDNEMQQQPDTKEIFDATTLQSLVGNNPAILKRLMNQYLNSSRQLGEQLRAAHAADDLEQVRSIAHQMKSAARSVGSAMLGDAAAELENACLAGETLLVQRNLAAFDTLMLTVDARIVEHIATME
jgi:PAS domain S-box-containing protein